MRIKQNIKISETVLESARDDKFGVNRNLTKNVILAGELEAIVGLWPTKILKMRAEFWALQNGRKIFDQNGLPLKKIGNKKFKLLGHHDRYIL